MANYNVLKPEESYRQYIHNKNLAQKFVKENIDDDFARCLTQYGLCDTPFAAVNKALFRAGFSHQSIMLKMQACIKYALSLLPARDDNSGDYTTPAADRVELKGSSCYHEKVIFKAKQIRPHHDVTHYMFHFYEGYNDKCWWLWVPAPKLYDLANEYGYFNHATHGTDTSNKDNTNIDREITFHPYTAPGTKSQKFWTELDPYKVSIKNLYRLVHGEDTSTSKPIIVPRIASLSEYFD